MNNFVLLILLNISLIYSSCIVGENHCIKCNPISNLCFKCDKDVYVPDEEGGCKNAHKCQSGKNKCLACDENRQICKECSDGFIPDENGGCSYTYNCEVSEEGRCLKCKDNYILIGKEDMYGEYELRICKSLFSDDLRNCEDINMYGGYCQKCKENYFLNSGDRKCSTTENCFKSSFGICTECVHKMYYDKRDETCKNQTEEFDYCLESIDGKTCDKCEDSYYLSEDKKCIAVNYCLKARSLYQCEECEPGYYPSYYGTSCVKTENCYNGDKDMGICYTCDPKFYMDYKDGMCKSNREDNEYKFCKIIKEDSCVECIENYELGLDNHCSTSKNCVESINGLCIECNDGYYLGSDSKCTTVEHCSISNYNYECVECEGKYYLNVTSNKCLIGEGKLENCKQAYSNPYCEICKDEFYLNQKDYVCYSNKEDNECYKCQRTDETGEKCEECIDEYYLGEKDNKCSKIEGCVLSENENKCLECDSFYCLDVPSGTCVYNNNFESEETRFYYKCHQTNKDGTACEICLEGYTLSSDGLCVDIEHCAEKNEDGSCKICQNDIEGFYCLNNAFGCLNVNFNSSCWKCNDILDIRHCDECLEGYTLKEHGICEKTE